MYEAQTQLTGEDFDDIGLLGNRQRRLERFCDYSGVKVMWSHNVVAQCGRTMWVQDNR
jgi:hypothetical protein